MPSEKHRIADQEYYLRNKEVIKKKSREWYSQNQERRKLKVAEYISNNREKHRNWIKKSNEKHKEVRRQKARERWAETKKLVFNHYGQECCCCGETHIEFLTIDHINGNGSKHRKEIKGGLYRWLVKQDFPGGFRTLCMNCNFALGKFGYCPHDFSKSSADKTKLMAGK